MKITNCLWKDFKILHNFRS